MGDEAGCSGVDWIETPMQAMLCADGKLSGQSQKLQITKKAPAAPFSFNALLLVTLTAASAPAHANEYAVPSTAFRPLRSVLASADPLRAASSGTRSRRGWNRRPPSS